MFVLGTMQQSAEPAIEGALILLSGGHAGSDNDRRIRHSSHQR